MVKNKHLTIYDALLIILLFFFCAHLVNYVRYCIPYVILLVLLSAAYLLRKYANPFVTEKAIKTALVSFCALFLLINYYDFNAQSWDGVALYLRNVLGIIKYGYVPYISFSVLPYLTEYFLAVLWKFGSINLMNTSFGMVYILCLLTSFKIFQQLLPKTQTNKAPIVWELATLVLATSPTLLFLTTAEYKIDMFLLLVSNLANLALLNYMEKQKTNQILLFGLLLSVGVLIKISYAFSAVSLVAIFGLFLVFFSPSPTIKKTISKMFFVVSSFLIPIILWYLFIGGYVPLGLLGLKDRELWTSVNASRKVELAADKTLQQECFSIARKNDRKDFLPGESVTDVLLQPYYYATHAGANFFKLLASNKYLSAITHFSNPGVFIFTSFFLFGFLAKGLKEHNTKFKLYYLYTFVNIIFFFFAVRSLYWYAIYIYPFLAIFWPLVISKSNKVLIAKTAILVITSYGILNTAIVFLDNLSRINPSKQLSELAIFQPDNFAYTLGQVINERTDPDKLILNASEHPYLLFTTFADNTNYRTVTSFYYFVSSRKSIDDIYVELKQKNIGYILVYKDALTVERYKGCQLENNLILKAFLEKYTDEIYRIPVSGVLFKIR